MFSTSHKDIDYGEFQMHMYQQQLTSQKLNFLDWGTIQQLICLGPLILVRVGLINTMRDTFGHRNPHKYWIVYLFQNVLNLLNTTTKKKNSTTCLSQFFFQNPHRRTHARHSFNLTCIILFTTMFVCCQRSHDYLWNNLFSCHWKLWLSALQLSVKKPGNKCRYINSQSQTKYFEQSKETKQYCTQLENFNICFCVLFDCYQRCFISGRGAGN